MRDIYDLHRMEEKALKEVGKLADKSEISLVDIEAATKAVKLIKEVEEVKQMCEDDIMDEDMYSRNSGYSYGYPRMSRRGSSYRMSGANSNRGGSYSRHDEREMVLDKLESMMNMSDNEQYRKILSESIDRINQMSH